MMLTTRGGLMGLISKVMGAAITFTRWAVFRDDLGVAVRKHPDWYLVLATVRGRDVELHGLGDKTMTLGDAHKMSQALSPDPEAPGNRAYRR
jgi:hypothetical protein